MNGHPASSKSTFQNDQSSTRIEETRATGDTPQNGLWCPNCGQALEAQKCKLFCRTSGCGYLVTCSEW